MYLCIFSGERALAGHAKYIHVRSLPEPKGEGIPIFRHCSVSAVMTSDQNQWLIREYVCGTTDDTVNAAMPFISQFTRVGSLLQRGSLTALHDCQLATGRRRSHVRYRVVWYGWPQEQTVSLWRWMGMP
jgi:hypothetical protein